MPNLFYMPKKKSISLFFFFLPFFLGMTLFYFTVPQENLFSLFKEIKVAYPKLTLIMTSLTNLGNLLFYPVYLFMLIKGLKNKDKKLTYFVYFYLIFQIFISFLLVRVLKIGLGRARPEMGDEFTFFAFTSNYHSFPSGHTTEIYGASLPLALRYKKPWLSFLLGTLAFTVGFSRIYLNKHHPLDVIGGFFLGNLSGYLIFYFWRKKCQELATKKR